jgi:hypothetical protein
VTALIGLSRTKYRVVTCTVLPNISGALKIRGFVTDEETNGSIPFKALDVPPFIWLPVSYTVMREF